MAESEYLDIDKSHRWQPLYHAVRNQEPIDKIATLSADGLRKAMNAIRKPAFKGGEAQVPLGDLLDALEHGSVAVRQVVRRCHGHDYACLFADATLGTTSREQALEQFMLSVFEKVCDQIEHKVVCPDGQRTFARIQSTLDQVRESVKPEIRRWAHQLASDPGSQLRRPKGRDVLVVDTKSILGESLLGSVNG